MDAQFQELSATTNSKGIGTVKWFICVSKGTSTSIETTAYYIQEAEVRHSSSQACFCGNKSDSFVMEFKVVL